MLLILPQRTRQAKTVSGWPGAVDSRRRLLRWPGLLLSFPCAVQQPGSLPERPKGAVCKTVGSAYDGSNPSAATRNVWARQAPTRLVPGAAGVFSVDLVAADHFDPHSPGDPGQFEADMAVRDDAAFWADGGLAA